MTSPSAQSEQSREPLSRFDAAWTALLVLVVGWLYAPMLGFSFLSLDDNGYVLENPIVRAGLSRETIARAFTSFREGHYHPLTILSHALDVQLFGLDAGAHHRTSLLLAMCLTAVAFFALRALGLRQMTAVFATALVVLHPLRIESFAWIATRKDLLSGLFFFVSLLAYAWFSRKRSVVRMLAVLVAFALALLCKPTVLILPLVCVLLDVWPLRRAELPTSLASLAAWRPLLLEKLPLFALSAASVAMTFASQQSAGAVQAGPGHSFGDHLANAGVSYLGYVGRFLWPVPISVFHPYQAIRPGLGLAAWLIVIASAIYALRSARVPIGARVGWLFYLCAFVPTIGFVQVGGQSMADRWLLLPGIGLVFAVISLFDVWLARAPEVTRLVLGVSVCVLLGVQTRLELPVFRDNVALYERALTIEDNFFCHNNLGVELEERGDLAAAEWHYREAVRLHPTYPLALVNLGNVFARRRDYAQAREMYTRALQREPTSFSAHASFGAMLSEERRYREALGHFRAAAELSPGDLRVQFDLGRTYLGVGDPASAAEVFRGLTERAPSNAEAFAWLGKALVLAGRVPQARAALERALAIDPSHTMAREMLAPLQR